MKKCEGDFHEKAKLRNIQTFDKHLTVREGGGEEGEEGEGLEERKRDPKRGEVNLRDHRSKSFPGQKDRLIAS